jgi:hypothetical protein
MGALFSQVYARVISWIRLFERPHGGEYRRDPRTNFLESGPVRGNFARGCFKDFPRERPSAKRGLGREPGRKTSDQASALLR